MKTSVHMIHLSFLGSVIWFFLVTAAVWLLACLLR